MTEEQRVLTVGEMKRELAGWSDDTEVIFGVSLSDRIISEGLSFNRFKGRGTKLLQIQLCEDSPVEPQ